MNLELLKKIGKNSLAAALFVSPILASASPMSPRAQRNLKKFLGENVYEVNLLKLENDKKLKASLAEQPWSDTYWPDTQGSLTMAPKGSFSDAYDARKELRDNLSALDTEGFDSFSPAEKYDILLGNFDFQYSNSVREMLKEMKRRDMIRGWSGVCHGWSPASLREHQPHHTVKVKLADGKYMNIYPYDIKGLLTFGWGKSNAQYSSIVEGWQCWGHLDTDPRGRATRDMFKPNEMGGDSGCTDEDLTAQFFHLAMVNSIGYQNRGFVSDMAFEKSVWNHPVYSYELRLYNATKSRWVETVKEAVSSVASSGPLPPALVGRISPEATKYVGIDVFIRYGVESGPTLGEHQNGSENVLVNGRFRYWLELDDKYNVVGAEWEASSSGDSMRDTYAERLHSQGERASRYWLGDQSPWSPKGRWNNATRPDIIWIPTRDSRPWAAVEWNTQGYVFDIDKTGVPKAVKSAARNAAKNIRYDGVPNPQILYSISRELLRLSRLEQSTYLDLTKFGYELPFSNSGTPITPFEEIPEGGQN